MSNKEGHTCHINTICNACNLEINKKLINNAINNNFAFLLNYLFILEIYDPTYNRNLLGWAVKHSNINAVKKLVHFSNINHKNYQGNTPLYEAVIHYNKEIINILLDNGADTTIINNNGETFEILLMKSVHKNGLIFFKNKTKNIIKRSQSYPLLKCNCNCDIDKHISQKIRKILFWRDYFKYKKND